MEDFQNQKSQIEQEAQEAKDEADRVAQQQKQALADQEVEKIRRDAEEKITQIQNEIQT